MWIPTSAAEIEGAAERGDLEETSSFDGKRQLPAKTKNLEIAIDVAAMTPAGGTIVYGLGEDDRKRLTVLSPIEDPELASERIDQIVQTTISEPPYVEITSLYTDEPPGAGYVVVHVPRSPRAPHMVQVKGEMRYYGRGAKGNRLLSEAEVARLYRQREDWEIDAKKVLEEVLSVAPLPTRHTRAHLHAFTRPVVLFSDQDWDRAAGRGTQLLGALTDAASEAPAAPDCFGPLRKMADWQRQGAEVWRLEAASDDREYLVRCDVGMDGRTSMFWSHAGKRGDEGSQETFVLFDLVTAATLASFFAIAGTVYDRAGYHGHVDVGVALTGIEGTLSAFMLARAAWTPHPYRVPEYRQTGRVLARELRSPEAVVTKLLRRLLDATVTINQPFDPFDPP